MLCWLLAGMFSAAAAFAYPDARANEAPVSYRVPYRLTATKHLLVRVKINGQGPYHFIVDTGAPSLYVSTAVARALKVTADENGWGTFDRFEIEGGVRLANFRGRIEDPFQLEGMNSLGLAGVKLDGILGFAVLSRFRLEIDLTRDTMKWTSVKNLPKVEEEQGKQIVPPGMEAILGFLKLFGNIAAANAPTPVARRGTLGMELEERAGRIVVVGVGADSPAMKAGLAAGDILREIQGNAVKTYADGLRRIAKLKAGDNVEINFERDGEKRTASIRLVEGF